MLNLRKPSSFSRGSYHSAHHNGVDSSESDLVDRYSALLDRQTRIADDERALHRQQREAWDVERQRLKAEIKALRLSLEGTFAGTRSTAPSSVTSPVEGEVTRNGSGFDGSVASRHSSQGETGARFWEGGSRQSSATPSRTFSAPRSEDCRLPSISETGRSHAETFPRRKPSDQISPHPANTHNDTTSNIVNKGIDVSHIRQDLDGITLKASAVPPAIVAKVQSPTPSLQSPASTIDSLASPSTVKSTFDTSKLSAHSPPAPESNLTKYAGHTPNAASISISTASPDSGLATPTQSEFPRRPPVTTNMSSMAVGEPGPVEMDEDPALRGPLGLENDGTTDPHFLTELDKRLIQEARKTIYVPSETSSSPTTSVAVSVTDDNSVASGGDHGKDDSTGAAERDDLHLSPGAEVDPEPEVKLKFKRSMNFGSAFGVGQLGTN
ncbi:MAG: hypothetical protein M1817_000917 [Caeruleum heppii]|nr:MAG: hypothetical protein M1817_000917 [Caeruleum heppii]